MHIEISNKKFLVKNRDRIYKPKVKIIHEIINGIEVVYMKDEYSGWIEGMNANGFGIINSTFCRPQQIIHPLAQKKIDSIFELLISTDNEDFFDIITNSKKNNFLEGNTLIYQKDKIFHLENNFIIEQINKTSIYTNHSINKDIGYTTGLIGLSSFIRLKIIEEELKNNIIQTQDDLINLLNQNYSNIDPRFHPYRDSNYTLEKLKMLETNKLQSNTTNQLLLNMTDKEFIFYRDKNNSDKTEYINNLPIDYTPQIKVFIRETEKNVKNQKSIFTNSYIANIYEKFNISL